MATLRGRDELQSDKKRMRQIISEYKVLKLEQFKKVLKNLDSGRINSIIKFMIRDNTLYIHDDICSAKEDWKHSYDPDLVKAFWILVDFWDSIRFNSIADYPAKLKFITDNDTYDVIVAHKGKEKIINMFYNNFSDGNVKHIIVVDSKECMVDFDFGNIFAYCIVSDDGEISYYRNEE